MSDNKISKLEGANATYRKVIPFHSDKLVRCKDCTKDLQIRTFKELIP